MSFPPNGALVISLDLELFWGVRDVTTVDAYRANLVGAHDAARQLLDRFGNHEIHATWACVGLLFAHDRDEGLAHAPRLRPSYDRSRLSPYGELEFADLDSDRRCYFAPDLIAEISSRPNQEVATHTFSHFYCTEKGQTAAQFDADLEAAIAIASKLGVRPTSLVFPRNQYNHAYLPVLQRRGINAFRGHFRSWMFERGSTRAGVAARRALRLADNYAPVHRDCTATLRRSGAAPLNIPGSRYLRPYTPALRHLDSLRMRRMKGEMSRAAERGGMYHLWWHPHDFGTHLDRNIELLDNLLVHARSLRDRLGFESLNMAELAAVAAA